MRVGFGSAVGVVLCRHLRHVRFRALDGCSCAMTDAFTIVAPRAPDARPTRDRRLRCAHRADGHVLLPIGLRRLTASRSLVELQENASVRLPRVWMWKKLLGHSDRPALLAGAGDSLSDPRPPLSDAHGLVDGRLHLRRICGSSATGPLRYMMLGLLFPRGDGGLAPVYEDFAIFACSTRAGDRAAAGRVSLAMSILLSRVTFSSSGWTPRRGDDGCRSATFAVSSSSPPRSQGQSFDGHHDHISFIGSWNGCCCPSYVLR